VVLAGACVGGGSTINWSASFRTPDWVREDWVALGLPAFG
jgi:long-chain-alcohol oxidase